MMDLEGDTVIGTCLAVIASCLATMPLILLALIVSFIQAVL